VSLIVDEHREYLSDPVRLDLFRRALADCVRPGAVVADIGTGTGILGLMACQAGAARVYAIEATGMAAVARSVAAANGCADRMHVLQAHSFDADLPERVDLCVSDFVGRFGFDAGIFEIYPAARARFLRPGGTLLPSAVSLFIAPVERADMDTRVRFWTEPRAGFDMSPAFTWAVNTGYPIALDRADLLGPPGLVADAPTGDSPRSGFRADLELAIVRDGVLHGLGGWCAARLSPGVTMTNSPLSDERIARRNVFFPIASPVRVGKGDRVEVRMRVLPADHIVSWIVTVVSASGPSAPQPHSTLLGMLLTRDDLVRSNPEFVPALTPRGAGRLTTLQLCDGRRRLRDVEDLVFARHPDLFESRGEAAAFVAEVVSGYAKR
jgi:protein arginine N-methyltransferase 1